MKFVLSVVVLLVSLILAGVVTLCGVIPLTGIGFWWWFLSSFVVTVGLTKWRFRSMKRFKLYAQRFYLRANRFFSKIDVKMAYSDEERKVSELQDKGIRLWKLCLRDKDTSISCSISNQMRQIEKNSMVIILSPINSIDYLMTIMDIDRSKSCLYEIRIGQKLAESVITAFDNENERRMKLGEEERRDSIMKDLDTLLQQEEMAIKPQK
jgi:hypothetical protein